MKKSILFALTFCIMMSLFTPITANAQTADEAGSPEQVIDFDMPTVEDLGDQDYDYLVVGTDQYNDQIEEIAIANNINPVFVKCIMCVESCGVIDAKKGSYYGLFQIGKSFGFDNDRMLTDSEYAIQCACEVIKSKAQAADDCGVDHSVYYVAKFYNGAGRYGKFVGYLFNQFSNGQYGDKDTSVFLDETKN